MAVNDMLVVTGHQERVSSRRPHSRGQRRSCSGAFLRGEPEGAIAGRLLEDGTTVVVIEKDQEALGLGPLSG